MMLCGEKMKNSQVDTLEDFADKKILITGNTGFKGSWLSIWLYELGAKVYGYALPCKNHFDNFNICNLESKIDQTYGDIRDAKFIDICGKIKPDMVFHLAAQPLVIESYKDPYETISTNVVGTLNFLECVKNVSSIKSAINITTDKVYENKEWVWGYRENDLLGGKDPYSISKVCSELISKSYMSSFNLKNLATVRAGNVIGGGDWSENRILPDIMKSYKDNKTAIIRNPHASRPWQFVLECLSGYLNIASNLYNDSKFGGHWNVGPKDQKNYFVIDVVNEILKFIPNLKFELQNLDQNKECHSLRLDISKAINELGWKPKLSFETTIDYALSGYLDEFNDKDILEARINQIKRYCGI